jgi:hypothetical protein
MQAAKVDGVNMCVALVSIYPRILGRAPGIDGSYTMRVVLNFHFIEEKKA